MGCCATGPCERENETHAQPGLVFHKGRFSCWLCYVMPVFFPPIVRCPKQLPEGQACRYVAGHRGDHRPGDKAPADAGDLELRKHEVAGGGLRDGDPKLAAERKRNPVFEKRQRAGPNYVPQNRRV